MISQTETQIQVEKVVAADAAAMFALLADPAGQVAVDGSDMLRAVDGASVITAVGQVFTVAMYFEPLGHYSTDNHVVEFVPDRQIAWMTARVGQPPVGTRWSWSLDPRPDGRTRVVHTYDWEQVTDPAVLARIAFPRVSAAQLSATVDNLAATAASRST